MRQCRRHLLSTLASKTWAINNNLYTPNPAFPAIYWNRQTPNLPYFVPKIGCFFYDIKLAKDGKHRYPDALFTCVSTVMGDRVPFKDCSSETGWLDILIFIYSWIYFLDLFIIHCYCGVILLISTATCHDYISWP